MQFLAAAIIGGLLQAAGSLVGRVLLSLGIGFVTYQGLDTGLNWIENLIKTNYAQMGVITNFLTFLWVDKALSMIFSAVAARLLLQGLTSGAVKKMVIK